MMCPAGSWHSFFLIWTTAACKVDWILCWNHIFQCDIASTFYFSLIRIYAVSQIARDCFSLHFFMEKVSVKIHCTSSSSSLVWCKTLCLILQAYWQCMHSAKLMSTHPPSVFSRHYTDLLWTQQEVNKLTRLLWRYVFENESPSVSPTTARRAYILRAKKPKG